MEWLDKQQYTEWRRQKPRRNRWALWWGMGIWVGCVIISTILELCGIEVDDQSVLLYQFNQLVESLGSTVTLAICCLIIPLMEEFCFRLWGKGTKTAYILDAVLIGVYTAMAFPAFWWVGLMALAVVLGITFCIPRQEVRVAAMIWATSIIFALLHITGYNGFSIGMLLGISQIMGLALVLSYLSVHHGWWWNALLHVCNNSFAFCVFLFSGEISLNGREPFQPAEFDNDGYWMKIEAVEAGEYTSYYDHDTADLTLSITYFTQDVLCSFYQERDTSLREFRHINRSKSPDYHVLYHAKDSLSHTQELMENLYALGLVEVDTTYVPTLTVRSYEEPKEGFTFCDARFYLNKLAIFIEHRDTTAEDLSYIGRIYPIGHQQKLPIAEKKFHLAWAQVLSSMNMGVDVTMEQREKVLSQLRKGGLDLQPDSSRMVRLITIREL